MKPIEIYESIAATESDSLEPDERIVHSIARERRGERILLVVALCSCLTLGVMAWATASISQNSLSHQQLVLRFRREETAWKFKILQIADIHLGEAPYTDWGPEQDRKTWLVLDKVLTTEKPDFIVLSGDQVSTNYFLPNTTAYYQVLGEFLSKYKIPWATTLGNHDDFVHDRRPENATKDPPKLRRRDLMAVDQRFSLSLSQQGPVNVFGASNYVLDVFIEGNRAIQIYLFDSGGGSIPKAIDDSQIQWFKTITDLRIPAIAFQHVPTKSYVFSSSSCVGYNGDGGIDRLTYDAGIVETLAQTKRFLFLAVGHNHGNDYCCRYNSSDMQVCFGRHSGYGGYGNDERGARFYELTINDDRLIDMTTMKWKSWARLESGNIIDKVSS